MTRAYARARLRPAIDRYDPRSNAPDHLGFTISHDFLADRLDDRRCTFCKMTRSHPNHGGLDDLVRVALGDFDLDRAQS